MLAEMRNARGGPNWRVRALALLLALLLAGPLTVFLIAVAARLLDFAV